VCNVHLFVSRFSLRTVDRWCKRPLRIALQAISLSRRNSVALRRSPLTVLLTTSSERWPWHHLSASTKPELLFIAPLALQIPFSRSCTTSMELVSRRSVWCRLPASSRRGEFHYRFVVQSASFSAVLTVHDADYRPSSDVLSQTVSPDEVLVFVSAESQAIDVAKTDPTVRLFFFFYAVANRTTGD